jgi:hypothetical protein
MKHAAHYRAIGLARFIAKVSVEFVEKLRVEFLNVPVARH